MTTCFKHFLRFFIISLLTTLYSFGQSTVILDPNMELLNIGKQTLYLEDPTLAVSIDELLKNTANFKFEASPQEAINFSSTASAYWLKFDIKKTTPGNYYLNVGSAYIDAISLYEIDQNNTIITTRHTGDDLPFDSREIAVGNYLFALNFEVGTTRTFYLRVKSDQPLFFPFKVGTLKNFVAYEHDLDFLQGMYFGFMLLIFLYNLFLYFSTKEKIYLFYIGYVFSMTWFMASVFGYFFEYFWPNAPFINQSVVASSGLTMITATLFTQNFLGTKKSNPKMHKGSMLFLIIGVLVCVLVISGFRIEGLKLAQGGLLLMAIYFLILGIQFKIKGYRPAKFYLLAWGALIVGIVFAILESLNITPVTPYLNAMQIGSALEVLLLSFALGDRINIYKKEKEEAQYEALFASRKNEKLIGEQNILLESKVKERTKEVAKQNEELLNLNKEKDMLVNIVAHDLRTPLSHIKGFIQLLNLTPSELTADQKTYLSEMDTSADRLTHMIARILNIHTLETKEIKLLKKIVNLNELVGTVVHSFEPTAEAKDITILMTPSEKKYFIEIDENYLIQVLENLISNAIKFSEKGNKVVLAVNAHNEKTSIEVQDFGPGISKDDQKKLFGKFQRLSAKPTAGESSTGLGLSIAKKYVEAMNGTIHCESQLGVGTKFTITFTTKEEFSSSTIN